MKLRFLKDFDFAPPELRGRCVIRYAAGKKYTGVRRIAARRAVEDGYAVVVEDDPAEAATPVTEPVVAAEGDLPTPPKPKKGKAPRKAAASAEPVEPSASDGGLLIDVPTGGDKGEGDVGGPAS
jgi:hypothetical protein